MRIRCMRFTVRRMIIAVAIGSVVRGAIHRAELREQYREEAEWNEDILFDLDEIRPHGFYPHCTRGGGPVGQLEYNAATAPRHARLVAHYTEPGGKYRHAARYPWLAVEPDPPVPE
jgi:hypothetical protein